MTSAERIKQGYERRPYPGTDLGKLIKKGGSMPALKWMQAIGRPGRAAATRVLVAGCGTGVEAFIKRQRLPEAEIVAVDFSPRSIAVAKRLQRAAGPKRPITFLVADLTDPELAAKTGGDFDLITCHGVLTYIPEPGRVLKNLAACLRPGGALYLGVNGSAHPATTLRPWLAGFGLVVDELKDERRLRELLGLWDSLHDDGIGELATMSASYLASDVCGSLFNSWSLTRWRAEANQAGLEIAATDILPMALRLTMDREHHRLLFPMGGGALAAKLDEARPAGFHQMMLRRAKAGGLDLKFERAPTQRLHWTGLYKVKFIKTADARKVTVVLSCAAFHQHHEWTLAAWQAEALRGLMEAGAAPEGWLKRWARSDAGRRIVWLWVGLGVIAVATDD